MLAPVARAAAATRDKLRVGDDLREKLINKSAAVAAAAKWRANTKVNLSQTTTTKLIFATQREAAGRGKSY